MKYKVKVSKEVTGHKSCRSRNSRESRKSRKVTRRFFVRFRFYN